MKKYTLLLLLTLFCTTAYASDNSSEGTQDNIQEIFVTGLAVPVETSKAGVGITTITKEEIEAINPTTFDEILRYIPGIVIRQNSSGKLTSLYLRGGASGSTMILLDGVPLSDSASIAGDIDLSAVPIDNIEKIEIVKGPLSASFGSSAMNGAINIITKKEGTEKPVEATIQLQSGLLSHNYMGNASVYGSKGIVDYRINGGYSYDENVSAAAYKYGNTENDPDAMGNFSGYINIKPRDDLNTSFYLDYVDRTSDLDNCGGAGCDNLDYLQATKRVTAISKTRYLYNDIWEPILNLSYVYNDRLYGSASEVRNKSGDIFDGHTFTLDFQNNIYIIDEFILTAGANYEYTEIYTKSGSLISANNRNSYSGYLQGHINLFDSWTTILSFRALQVEDMGFAPLYRVSSVYDISKIDLQIKAALGNGVLSPSLYQLYDPAYGNSSLETQESFAYEVGFENTLFNKILNYGLSWFDNYYNNMIAYGSYIDSDDNIKTGFYNETKTHTRGIEADINISPIKYINFGVGYTWLQTFNVDGNPLSRRPEHQATGYINIMPIKNLKINIGLIYSGESVASVYDTGDFNDAYFLLNANISYKINDNLEIYLKGTNLTDTEYEEIYGYGTKGIEIFLGLKGRV